MALRVQPLHPNFAAEASGIDLRRPIDGAIAAEIEQAMDRHAVLVFRDQPIDEDQQIAFTNWFGPLDLGLKKVLKTPSRFKHAETIDISNIAVDGGIAERDSKRIFPNLANQPWHSDSSFQQPPAKYSILCAQIVPPQGGETEYADMRAAYDALPDDTKRAIDGLVADHSALHSRIMLGEEFTDEQKQMMPPVRWPLVRTHPGSQRRTLFVGIHTTRVHAMTLPEGRILLRDLLEHATQREFVYRHHWRAGDLVMWDNRCTLHRGRHFDVTAAGAAAQHDGRSVVVLRRS